MRYVVFMLYSAFFFKYNKIKIFKPVFNLRVQRKKLNKMCEERPTLSIEINNYEHRIHLQDTSVVKNGKLLQLYNFFKITLFIAVADNKLKEYVYDCIMEGHLQWLNIENLDKENLNMYTKNCY
jgi:hypothetical protein